MPKVNSFPLEYNSSMATKRTPDGMGMTKLRGGARLPKIDPRIASLGDLDETSAALGLARSSCQAGEAPAILLEVQRALYLIMAEIAAPFNEGEDFPRLEQSHLERLEFHIIALSKQVTLPREFIVPGDSPSSAVLDLARTVTRRAERSVLGLVESGRLENPLLFEYLNRLSYLCYLLELKEIDHAGLHPTRAQP
jgi:cob(I)alamin adenosyltransferase